MVECALLMENFLLLYCIALAYNILVRCTDIQNKQEVSDVEYDVTVVETTNLDTSWEKQIKHQHA